jgi:retron-type reverse transcriptase
MKLHSTKSEFFTQIRGIPQGSVLSPLLCNLYYGDVENRVLLSTTEVSSSLHPKLAHRIRKII